MTPRSLLVLSFLAASACASSRPAPAATSPAPAADTTPAVAGPPPTTLREAPRDWQLLDLDSDGVPGISVRRAERELLAGRQPRRTVLVAVIDGGIDTAHADLVGNLWRNPKEVAGNGRDDDGNGYTDDVWGWNFIGGRDGRSVHHDTYEVTRLYAKCRGAGGGSTTPVPGIDQSKCLDITTAYNKERVEAQQLQAQVSMIDAALSRALPILRRAAGTDSLTVENVQAIDPAQPDVRSARQIFLQLAASGITPQAVADAKKEVEGRLQFGLDPDFDPRPIVGDDPADAAQRQYGNRDVMGPDAKHGSHVAGIVGALRDGAGIDGVAPAVRIMMVRAVPDGDERDKDIANAIRYAVDNGAHVINMSFGKAFSPQKAIVDSAVRYADAKGVLMVHAAGNEGEDIGQNPSFPTPAYLGGGRAANWIEVGASTWKGGDSLVASFSNYGAAQVDVFAPGADILSTVPNGTFDRASGTSMAAPVVSGLAALLMAYHPELTAADVKRIILASATRFPTQSVIRPGEGDVRVRFGQLSVTGGIVNARAALRMAAQQAAPRP